MDLELMSCRVCGYEGEAGFITLDPSVGTFCYCMHCGHIFVPTDNSNVPEVEYVLLPSNPKEVEIGGAPVYNGKEPFKAHDDDTGWDVFSAEDHIVGPGKVQLVKTNVAFNFPKNIGAQVRCRSGLGKKGIQVSNGPGTVDQGYTGDVGVLIYNSTDEDFEIKMGDRIAQLVFEVVRPFKLKPAGSLKETARGATGYGHSGKN